MGLDKNAIKNAKTAGATKKAATPANAGATKKAATPANAGATPKPRTTATQAKIQTESTAQVAGNIAETPATPNSDLGRRSGDLKIVQFAFTEHDYDTSPMKRDDANALVGKLDPSRISVSESEVKEGETKKDSVSVKRPRAVAVEVENISDEPVTYSTTEVLAEEIGEKPYNWGMVILGDPERRGTAVLKPGEKRWVLLSELIIRLVQPDFNNEITGGDLPFKVSITQRGKKNDLAASATAKLPTLSLRKYDNSAEYINVLDAPGIIAVKSDTINSKKNLSFYPEAPAELQDRLKDFIEHFNTHAANSGSRVGSSSRITAKGETKKRNDKADQLLSLLKLEVIA